MKVEIIRTFVTVSSGIIIVVACLMYVICGVMSFFHKKDNCNEYPNDRIEFIKDN